MRRLIVNADDFGLCSGVVRGILRGVRHGIITSTSLMLTVPATQLALEQAHAHPNLDVGVHLTFTEGWPLISPEHIPSLVNEQGRFLSAEEWQTSGRRPVLGELRLEFRAQIEGVLVTGINASHLDMHMSLGYLLPNVFAMTVNLAAEHGLAIRFPQANASALMAAALGRAAGLPDGLVQQMVAADRRIVAERGVNHADRFIEAFPAHNTDPAAFIALLRGLPDGTTEMLTHPALLRGSVRYLGAQRAAARAAELTTLCDPTVRQAVIDAGIELVSFRQL
jgi:chitin disaccharide deacetylase